MCSHRVRECARYYQSYGWDYLIGVGNGVVEYFKVGVLTTSFLSITRSLTSKYGLKYIIKKACNSHILTTEI